MGLRGALGKEVLCGCTPISFRTARVEPCPVLPGAAAPVPPCLGGSRYGAVPSTAGARRAQRTGSAVSSLPEGCFVHRTGTKVLRMSRSFRGPGRGRRGARRWARWCPLLSGRHPRQDGEPRPPAALPFCPCPVSRGHAWGWGDARGKERSGRTLLDEEPGATFEEGSWLPGPQVCRRRTGAESGVRPGREAEWGKTRATFPALTAQIPAFSGSSRSPASSPAWVNTLGVVLSEAVK